MKRIQINSCFVRRCIFSAVVLSLFLFSSPLYSQEADVNYKIGVLAKRGPEICLKKWGATAEYLTDKIDGASFSIIPLRFDEIYSAVLKEEIDFVITNPAFYVELEVIYEVQRLATLKNMRIGKPYTVFGGVTLYKSSRSDIKTLEDLKGKRFAAVDPSSFGGWIMSLREFKSKGIDPYKDFKELQFLGTHDAVVYAVRDGIFDAGSVRTDTLERMAKEGKIKISDFKVIHEHGEAENIVAGTKHEDFPFFHSTRLYPEWPFSKLKHTNHDIAEEVLSALLSIKPEDPAAIDGKYAGWTIPLHYQSVKECLKELRFGPYENYRKITLEELIEQYFAWIMVILILLTLIFIALGYVMRLNIKLKHSKEKTELSFAQLKRTESILRESESRYKYLFESARDIIVITDLKGSIIALNKIVEQYGFKREDIIGRNHLEFIPEEYHKQAIDDLERIKQGEVTHGQMEVITPKGRLHIEYSDNPIIENNKITGVQSVLRDITHRKELENTQRLAQLGRFVAAMAHEVNNPLMIISGRAQLASMEDIQNEEVKNNLGIVMKECQRAKDIINRLLRFSQTSKKGTAKIDVNKILNETIDILEHQFSLEGIIINRNYADNLPLVLFNEKQLQEVIMNLLTNARDAIVPEKGTIDIITSKEGDKAKIEVRDSGIGMERETLEKIYEPFFTTKDKGTGLGLSVCYSTITEHNGQLKITSTPGEGTRAMIILPAA